MLNECTLIFSSEMTKEEYLVMMGASCKYIKEHFADMRKIYSEEVYNGDGKS